MDETTKQTARSARADTKRTYGSILAMERIESRKHMYPFDQNNQQLYQQYANHAEQGTYAQIPEQEAYQNYGQFVQNAPPQMVQQAHEQYYQQMPPQQRGNLMQGLLGGLMQRGVTPQQMGIQNANPYSMSPQE